MKAMGMLPGIKPEALTSSIGWNMPQEESPVVPTLVLWAECFLPNFICLNLRLLSPSQLSTWHIFNYNRWKERQKAIHAVQSAYLFYAEWTSTHLSDGPWCPEQVYFIFLHFSKEISQDAINMPRWLDARALPMCHKSALDKILQPIAIAQAHAEQGGKDSHCISHPFSAKSLIAPPA